MFSCEVFCLVLMGSVLSCVDGKCLAVKCFVLRGNFCLLLMGNVLSCVDGKCLAVKCFVLC